MKAEKAKRSRRDRRRGGRGEGHSQVGRGTVSRQPTQGPTDTTKRPVVSREADARTQKGIKRFYRAF